MKVFVMKPLFIIFLSVILLLGSGIPSESTPMVSEELQYIQCEPDGNNSSVTATLIQDEVMIYDAVCEEDTHDWYILPLIGDVTWGGDLYCDADEPGLRVAVYADVGTGLQLLQEATPSPIGQGDDLRYNLIWKLSQLAAGMGQAAAPAGVYYIRVTYYTYHPGVHAYRLGLHLKAEGFTPPLNTTSNTATQLPPGATLYGHLDVTNPSNWFTFTIGPGQSGTGIIFAKSPRINDSEKKGPYIYTTYDLRLRSSNLTLLGSAPISYSQIGYLDSVNLSALPPGSYFIELAEPTGNPSPDWEASYMVFNQSLAPDTGDWGPDANNDISTSVTLPEGVPVPMSSYNPRDFEDFFKFTSSGYYLGDILIEPPSEMPYLHGSIIDENAKTQDSRAMIGRGFTNRVTPLEAGDYYIRIFDWYKMFSPVHCTLTYYEHGEPMTGPVGHETPEMAHELPPGEATPFQLWGKDQSIDFQPGIQDIFVYRVDVPQDAYLVGYYEFKGSRVDYNVRFGKSVAGNLQWSPAHVPDSKGKLLVDMNYDYLVDAGTYYVKIKMLASSPGRMRVYLDNNSRIASLEPDENNNAEDAINLKSIKKGNNYYMFGDVSPYDHADWYHFKTDDFDPNDGPDQFLRLKGAVPGMKVHVINPDSLGSMAVSEVQEAGGYAILDLDGVAGLSPNKKFYVMVAYADIDQVQVYDLELCPDFKFIPFPGHMLELIPKPKLKLKPGVYVKIDDDDDD